MGGNFRERNHLEKLGVDVMLILKLGCMDWFVLAHYRDKWRAVVCLCLCVRACVR